MSFELNADHANMTHAAQLSKVNIFRVTMSKKTFQIYSKGLVKSIHLSPEFLALVRGKFHSIYFGGTEQQIYADRRSVNPAYLGA